jgi:hypothetical protein
MALGNMDTSALSKSGDTENLIEDGLATPSLAANKNMIALYAPSANQIDKGRLPRIP